MIFRFISALLMAIGVGFAGVWIYQDMSFDFATAPAEARATWLDGKARSMKGTFKPNYLSKSVGGTARGSSLTFTYNTGMGSLTCGQKVDCDRLQCGRYLRSAPGKNGLTVRVIYTDNTGRQIGAHTLTRGFCQRHAA
ncbi:MAG: hypothetical protein AAGJ29_08180 [Pseudomonadota bacterium]